MPLVLLCVLAISACGKQRVVPGRDGKLDTYQDMIRDLNDFPQDLTVYAKAARPDAKLLGADEQLAQDRRFNEKFFSAFEMTSTRAKAKTVASAFGKGARGYVDANTPWSDADWNRMKANANLKHFPSRSERAITVRHTSLRELPTSMPRSSKPKDINPSNPFDLFQYTSFHTGTPMFIAHQSADGQWVYVENSLVGGWLPAADVAVVDQSFINAYRQDKLVALVSDNVRISTNSGQTIKAQLGTILPMADRQDDLNYMSVIVPMRDRDGRAYMETARVTKADAVIKPIPLTPRNIAAVGNKMMGQPYGWGGMYENRDCSSTLRDLFIPFGIWLPRNSAAQAKSASLERLDSLSGPEKEARIINVGVPFMSMIWMPGHIGLYLGKYRGQAAFFHNIWGVRTLEPDGSDGRHVIGRAVVTSLQPGKELENLYNGSTIRDRITGVSTLP